MQLIEKKKLRREFENFVERFGPTHFVTLATNAYNPVSQNRMRDLLKAWSARVNRALLGGRWQKKPDEHVFFFAFLEKPHVNPHWHLLLQADIEMISDLDAWKERFAQHAEKAWTDLLPAGTVDVQRYHSRDVIDYTLKSAFSDVEYVSYVVPREYY
ncbi:hypothetical protein [Stappia indica]|uniref:hypothetical protein n=1 Tax=Stappia indica TaxID=538381 RepID=UPI001111E790|nr:hypothetical protein [Stappia indica]